MSRPLLPDDEPHLVAGSALPALLDGLHRGGIRVGRISVAGVRSTVDLFDQLRTVLTLPSYCGSGWDSFDDASDEIEEATEFPLVLVVDDLVDLLARDPHLALHTVLQLADEARRWTREGTRWHVVLPLPGPPPPGPPARPLQVEPALDHQPFDPQWPRMGEPFLVGHERADLLGDRLAQEGRPAPRVELGSLRTVADLDSLIAGLRAAVRGQEAPRFAVVDGLPALLNRDPALAVRVVLGLGLSVHSGVHVIYPGAGWP